MDVRNHRDLQVHMGQCQLSYKALKLLVHYWEDTPAQVRTWVWC